MLTVDQLYRCIDNAIGDEKHRDQHLIEFYGQKIIDFIDMQLASIIIQKNEKLILEKLSSDDQENTNVQFGVEVLVPFNMNTTMIEYIKNEYIKAGYSSVGIRKSNGTNTIFTFNISNAMHKIFFRGVKDENKEIEKINEGNK